MINDTILVVIAASAIAYGTPLLFAALGELLAERSGVLNLGVEGMMLMGAVSGFWAVQTVGGPGWMVLLIAVLVAALVAAATALIHAVLTISLRASQIVSGLALTIFAGASGLSSYVGHVASLGGQPARHEFAAIDVLEQEPEIIERLWENTRFFKAGLQALGFSTGSSESPITPVIVGEGALAMRLSDALFVWGRRDRVVPIAFARHVTDALPNARHVELDCGHVPQVERPRETHAAIGGFLAEAGDEAA